MRPIHHPELDQPWETTDDDLRRAADAGRFKPLPLEEYSPPPRDGAWLLGAVFFTCVMGALVAAIGLLIYRLPAIKAALAATGVGP